MMDTTIRTFEECIGIANHYVKEGGIPSKKHLILGNGFSIDFCQDIFSYPSLVSRVTSPHIKALFDKLGTSDFEYVMRKLTDALKLVSIYPRNNLVAYQIEMDLVELRKSLIEAISESHPEDPTLITPSQYEHCRLFLNHFKSGKKYTFNYDLLLYWVCMQFMIPGDKYLKTGDGFGRPDGDLLKWHSNPFEEQTVYYLHGAIHLFNDSGILKKLSWGGTGKTIKEQVCHSISTGTYPMFISEGTKDHKRSRIQSSSYLDHAFRSLDDINDNLFIFGHSLGEEDDHVFDRAINQSNLKNIFISIFDGAEPAENKIIIDKVKRWAGRNHNKNYYLYDAASANVWGP